METTATSGALITNDAIVLGLLMAVLGLVFYTSSRETPFWKKFYTFVPSLLLCYFLPSLLTTFGVIDPDQSQLYFVASRFLLPTSLLLLTLSVDLPGIARLGSKAVIMFLTGTVGIVLGGPLAILLVGLVSPETVGGEGANAVWRGLTTVAGSWIGGGANQAAMKEVFEVGDEVFSAMVAVDVIVANVWMAVLLWAAGREEQLDAKLGADSSAITALRRKVADYQASIAKMPKLADTMIILGIGFFFTAVSHWLAGGIAPWIEGHVPGADRFSLTSTFFWLIVFATTFGVVLSFTRARQLEGVGASRLGSVMIYVLVATIGMKMDLMAIFERPGVFLIGLVWMAFHAGLLILVAKLIKAPVFFAAVGSQANVGGAASAPIVAAAFHPALAPVGVLLAVLGYVLGTYGAWLCGQLMRVVSGG
jgi:uncharacterized membrane protein